MTRFVTHNWMLLLVLGLAALALPARAESAPARGHAHPRAHLVARSAAHSASHSRALHTAHQAAHTSAKSPRHSAKASRNQAANHPPEPAHTRRHSRHAAAASQSDDAQPQAEPATRSVARAVPAVEYSTSRRHTRAQAKARFRHSQTVTDSPLRQVHLAMPAPLRGSYESLVHQNEMADAEGLERILDDADLENRIQQKSLVSIPVSSSLQVNPELPENRRYCRPWTARFLTDISQAHAAHFPGAPLLVTSAVRTVEYQRRLRMINGNAAAAEGDVASPHLTGGTIDIAKHGLNQSQIAWFRAWLLPLEQAGKIDVEEEFKQACFHISVYKTYAPDTDMAHHNPPASAEQAATPFSPKGR